MYLLEQEHVQEMEQEEGRSQAQAQGRSRALTSCVTLTGKSQAFEQKVQILHSD